MTAAETLTNRMGGRWRGTYGEARCPAHDDASPSLTVRAGDTAALLKCHAGCATADIIDALRRAGIWPLDTENVEKPTTADDRRRRQAETRAYLMSIWREARPISDTLAEVYLRERGIRGALPPTLRFHPGLKHKDTGLILPTMVAAVQAPDRTICAIHRTYLRADGLAKAPVSAAKMALGSYRAGAIRLAAADTEMSLGEGVETTLSYMQITGIPSWAAICAGNLAIVVLPPLPLASIVHVLVDLDAAGEQFSKAAAQRFAREGRRVKLARPACGKDFNDALREVDDAR